MDDTLSEKETKTRYVYQITKVGLVLKLMLSLLFAKGVTVSFLNKD
jgi:hypothetical protein